MYGAGAGERGVWTPTARAETDVRMTDASIGRLRAARKPAATHSQ